MNERYSHARVQRVSELGNDVMGENRITSRQTEINGVISQFLKGKIDAVTQQEQLLDIAQRYQDIPRITISNPWSLYGLIRFGVGMDLETTVNTVTEEVGHYLAAKKYGFDPLVAIEAENQINSIDGSSQLAYWTFVIAHIPEDPLDEQKMRAEITNTITAPGSRMSPDDREKLP